jgi:hypothetical protein
MAYHGRSGGALAAPSQETPLTLGDSKAKSTHRFGQNNHPRSHDLRALPGVKTNISDDA